MCNAGDVVIGGYTRAQGVTNLTGDQRFAAIAPIGPAPAAQGWRTTATGATSAPDFLDVFAVCLNRSTTSALSAVRATASKAVRSGRLTSGRRR
jgi:hypothetical protein